LAKLDVDGKQVFKVYGETTDGRGTGINEGYYL
jgi:hypothetical protein